MKKTTKLLIMAAMFYYTTIDVLHYIAIEIKFRTKCLYRNIAAFCTGYITYSKKIQLQLDHNQRGYEGMKQYKDGYYYNGKLYSWIDYKLY